MRLTCLSDFIIVDNCFHQLLKVITTQENFVALNVNSAWVPYYFDSLEVEGKFVEINV